MLGLIIAATVVLGLSALAAQIMRRGSHAMRRLILLGGMVSTLILPLAGKVTELIGFRGIVPMPLADDASPVGLGSTYYSAVLFSWLVGVLLMSIRLGWQVWLMRGIAARSRPVNRQEMAAISEDLSPLNPDDLCRFRVSDEIETPMVLAGLRQLVLLPARWFQWSPRLRASSLRHEWQHVQAADAQWSVLVALFRVLLWFHPLAWWVSARWSEECEHLADLAATSRCDSADYASDLLSLVCVDRVNAFELATAFAPLSQSRMERRLRTVLEDAGQSSPCGRVARAVVSSVFATAAVLISSCFHSPAKPTAVQLEVEAQTRLEANPFPADR